MSGAMPNEADAHDTPATSNPSLPRMTGVRQVPLTHCTAALWKKPLMRTPPATMHTEGDEQEIMPAPIPGVPAALQELPLYVDAGSPAPPAAKQNVVVGQDTAPSCAPSF